MTDEPRHLPVGELIELRRRQRGLSRAVVAELIGRSEEWLRQVERGSRRLDSIEAMVRLADVLNIEDMTQLIDVPSRQPLDLGRRRQEEIGIGIRRALLAYVPDVRSNRPRRRTDQVRRDVDEAWRSWTGSRRRYSRVAQRLPELLVEVATFDAPRGSSGDVETFCAAHHLARSLLGHIGEHQMAWLAADRAYAYAAGHHSRLSAVCIGHVVKCLMTLDYHEEALWFVLQAAERLRLLSPDIHNTTIMGALWMLAARCATAGNEPQQVERLTAMAAEAATAIHVDRTEHHVWFGPTEVAMTSILIELRMGRTTHALRLATNLDIAEDVPASRRASYFIMLADAYAHRKDDVAAVFSLVRARQACPEDIRYDRTARRVLSLLMRRGNQMVRHQLLQLSRLAGIVR